MLTSLTQSRTMAGSIALLIALLAAMGCAPPAVPDSRSAAPAPGQGRTLVMAINTEVSSLSPKAVLPTSPGRTTRLFNAGLTLPDAQDTMHPYLAESLPRLNSD